MEREFQAGEWLGQSLRFWLDLQGDRSAALRLSSDREVMGPVWQLLMEALALDGVDDDEGRLRALTFVGATVLGTVLDEAQRKALVGSEGGRERWREDGSQPDPGLAASYGDTAGRLAAEAVNRVAVGTV